MLWSGEKTVGCLVVVRCKELYEEESKVLGKRDGKSVIEGYGGPFSR